MNKVTILLLLGALMGGVARGQANPCNSANHHCVVLAWSPSRTKGIAGYNVFRGTQASKESSSPLNASPVAAGCSGASCTWTDNNVQAGVTYYYYITAVTAGGVVQSPPSNEASATVPVNVSVNSVSPDAHRHPALVARSSMATDLKHGWAVYRQSARRNAALWG